MKSIINLIKKYIVYIIVIIISIVLIIIFNQNTNIEEDNNKLISNTLEVEEYIIVDLKGAVVNPGVYKLTEGSRVMDLITLSGGIRDDAEMGILNLSLKLKDQDVIVIYNKYEIEEMKKDDTSVLKINNECICPQIKTEGCIQKTINNNEEKDDTSNPNKKIPLNSASKSELETLPGIGSSKADAIIEYRNQNGGFKTLDELKKVSGIGEKTYEKLKSYIIL